MMFKLPSQNSTYAVIEEHQYQVQVLGELGSGESSLSTFTWLLPVCLHDRESKPSSLVSLLIRY